jgi:LysM repeat protein
MTKRLAVLGALWVALLFGRSQAAAQELKTIRHRVDKDDTLDLLAAEYYGSRDHSIFIMKVNDMTHKRPLVRGERLKIPISLQITTEVGDTWEGLAEKHLGDRRRAPFLAEFNKRSVNESVPAGEVLTVPFHVTHTADQPVTLREIAAAYYRAGNRENLLREYNFMTTDKLEVGQSVVIPIYHVTVQPSMLPKPDNQSRELSDKRRQVQKRARDVLPDAQAAWETGDYQTVKRQLTQIETDFLDVDLAISVGVLLGSAYVAFDDNDSAQAAFKKVLSRAPSHTLNPYQHSPKVRKIWQAAGGKVGSPP